MRSQPLLVFVLPEFMQVRFTGLQFQERPVSKQKVTILSKQKIISTMPIQFVDPSTQPCVTPFLIILLKFAKII